MFLLFLSKYSREKLGELDLEIFHKEDISIVPMYIGFNKNKIKIKLVTIVQKFHKVMKDNPKLSKFAKQKQNWLLTLCQRINNYTHEEDEFLKIFSTILGSR